MAIKVAKFGGSSLANAEQFKKVYDIICADGERRYIIPSAPGRACRDGDKVTDMLYACYGSIKCGRGGEEEFCSIRKRYRQIVNGLELGLDIDAVLDSVWRDICEKADKDFTASRGEYINGIILAKLLEYDFVDPAYGIFFDEDGVFDPDMTQQRLSVLLSRHERAVVPGFYGALPDGRIKTFDRGGSDITGAIVARAVKADLYENWSDVSGIIMVDPNIVPDAKPIKILTYRELRELSYMGAKVLHEDSIFPVRQSGIPINVRNTNDPAAPGTMIVPRLKEGEGGTIAGIAGRKNFTVINMEKDQMNKEKGFGKKILQVLEDNGVAFEHLPTGIDTISIVISNAQLAGGRLSAIVESLKARCRPDVIDVQENLALIATVGHGMISSVGISGRLFGSLGTAGVNVRMIDQGSSEMNIIVGVQNEDFEVAVRAIYSEFSR